MNGKIREITLYSHKQSDSVSEIAQGLEQISSVVQKNPLQRARNSPNRQKRWIPF